MAAQLSAQEMKQVILDELPHILRTDPDFRMSVLQITSDRYAEKERTEDRIDRILDELKHDREDNQQKWVEQRKASDQKWEKNQQIIEEMLMSIKTLGRQYDSSIGALGARWGLHSEAAFRHGLRAILEESFGVKVERYEDFDYDGTVFGRPDQIELDVLVYNDTVILCELKSSMGRSQMYAFWRKRQFYEKKHGRPVDRALVISPMVEDRAGHIAKELGIEVYSWADAVPILDK